MEERFLRVVALISATPKEIVAVSNNKKVELYAYYKQAIVGKCNIPVRPGWFDIAGRYKWDAWSRLGDMPKELAMQHYMEEALPILQQCADITFEQVESYMKRYVQPDDRPDVEAIFSDIRKFVRETSYSDDEDRFSFEDVPSNSIRRRPHRNFPASPTMIPGDVPSIPEPDTPPSGDLLPSPSTPPIPPPPELAVAVAEELLNSRGELGERFAYQGQRQSPVESEQSNRDVSNLLKAVMSRLAQVEQRLASLEVVDHRPLVIPLTGAGDDEDRKSRAFAVVLLILTATAPILAYGVWHAVKNRRK